MVGRLTWRRALALGLSAALAVPLQAVVSGSASAAQSAECGRTTFTWTRSSGTGASVPTDGRSSLQVAPDYSNASWKGIRPYWIALVRVTTELHTYVLAGHDGAIAAGYEAPDYERLDGLVQIDIETGCYGVCAGGYSLQRNWRSIVGTKTNPNNAADEIGIGEVENGSTGTPPPRPGHETLDHVGLTRTPDGRGSWRVDVAGAVYAAGSAAHYGELHAAPAAPVVGIDGRPTGRGYWLVASDGGIFGFGDAGFHGSAGAMTLNHPIVGMAATPTGQGYWLVASDGGIFSFGDAGFHGSTGAMTLNHPIAGMAATPTGQGYWLVASDGGIFAFGDSGFHGSTGGTRLNAPIVAMAPTPTGRGYWLLGRDGGVFTFGDAPFCGGDSAAFNSRSTYVGIAANGLHE